MKKIIVIMLLSISIFAHAQTTLTLSEYCGNVENFNVVVTTSTPLDFLEDNSLVQVAINGPYYDVNGNTEGIVIGPNNHTYSSRSGEIRGDLFVVDDSIFAVSRRSEFFVNNPSYHIGTHPLLTVNGEISSQADESRYNWVNNKTGVIFKAFRSAIGTKDGVHICVTVSDQQVTMSEWARLLLKNGYKYSINLDGGPISQLAIRGKGSFGGGGTTPTRMIFYFSK